jgi:hypothetical protein
MNEYKMIKNSIEMDEAECLTVNDKTYAEVTPNKEIQELHKEVISLHVHDHIEEDEHDSTDNIEDLKASILNQD